MANNVNIAPAAGPVVATDDAGGAHYQVVKIAAGTEDSVDRIGGDATFGLDVDVVRLPSLPAGANAIGKLAANSGVDIGDVDVTSVIPGTGATSLGKAEDAAHASGDVGVMALAVRQDAAIALGAAGDYLPLIVDAMGRQWVNTELPDAAALADAAANPTAPFVAGANALFNGATWDRQRGNEESTLLASAARTATAVSAIQTNHNARGVVIFLRVTEASGLGGLIVRLRGSDPASGVLTPFNPDLAAFTTVGTRIFLLYPGIASSGFAAGIVQAISGVLSRTWRADVFHNDASSYTYSLGAALIL